MNDILLNLGFFDNTIEITADELRKKPIEEAIAVLLSFV